MEEFLRIERPNIGRFAPEKLVTDLQQDGVQEFIEQANNPEYLYWTKFKTANFLPEYMVAERLWAILKLRRKFAAVKTPVKDYSGKNFFYVKLQRHDQILYQLTSAAKPSAEVLAKGILQESVYSSILSGVEILPTAAKNFITEKRFAKSAQEKLVLSNYKSFKAFLEKPKLGSADIKELAGQEFRGDGEADRFVSAKSKILYVAPTIKIAEQGLAELLDYLRSNEFSHPVIKAITTFFWFSILRPFARDNGRVARALFYWVLQHEQVSHLFSVSLSQKILEEKRELERAFQYAEQDDNDITYFIDFVLEVLADAFTKFQQKQLEAIAEEENLVAQIQLSKNYNARQIRLLNTLAGVPNSRINFSRYIDNFQISRRTAALDLNRLVQDGALIKRKLGKNQFYYLAQNI